MPDAAGCSSRGAASPGFSAAPRAHAAPAVCDSAPFRLPGLRPGHAPPPAHAQVDAGGSGDRPRGAAGRRPCAEGDCAARTYHVDQLKATLEAAIGDQLEAQKALDDARRALRDGEALDARARAEAERQAARDKAEAERREFEERARRGSRRARGGSAGGAREGGRGAARVRGAARRRGAGCS